MSSVLVRTEPPAPFQFVCTRGTAYLSDGRLLTIVVWNDVDGTYEFRVGDSGRTAFTTGYSGDDVESEYFSFTVDQSDNVHICYTKKGTKNLRYCKFTKDVGVYEWTNTGSESVGTLVGSNWGRRDIEVFEEGNVLILASRVDPTTTPDTPAVVLYVRAASAWTASYTYTSPATSGIDTFASMTCSVARDTAAASGGYRRAMIAYHLNQNAACIIASVRVKTSDGTVDQVTEVKRIEIDGTYKKTWGMLFSTGNNEWIFGGVHGHANGASGKKMLCYKLSYTTVLGTATPVPSNDFVGGNAWTTLSTFQMMGTGSDGRLVCFSPRISSSTAQTGLYSQICRIVGNVLTWGTQAVFQTNIGAEYIRAGANRNLQTRWADVVSTRAGDHKTYYAKLDAPIAPTGVLPAHGSSLVTSRPTLAATLPPAQGRVRGQWQTATDSGFTTSVKTTLEPDADLRASGATTEVPSVGNALVPQGVFYVRAAAMNEFGVLGPYTAGNQLTITHPPSAANMSPTGNASRTPDTRLSWTFSDPYVNDVQSAYQLVIEQNSDGAVLFDSGKITSSDTFFDIEEWDILDIALRWKVKLWDADDVAGAWSSYHIFTVYEPATIVITTPTGTVNNPSPPVEWTFTASAGRTQAKYGIAIHKMSDPEGFNFFEVGLFAGDDLHYEFDAPVLENETDYTIVVFTVDSKGVESFAGVEIHSSWIPPESPPFTVDGWMAALVNYVPVLWDDSVRDEAFVGYRLYRRLAGGTAEKLIYSTSDAEDYYEFHDWVLPSNVPCEWALVQVALRFGAEVESVKVWVTDEAPNDKYWLLHPTDPTQNLCLWHVTADGFVDEWEEETLNLINRGRKKDRGTHFGYVGSLTLDVRDRIQGTARQQRLELEALRAIGGERYLRNPFGDLFVVSLSNISIERMPGVGTRDFHTATVPYAEVT